jgi:hypothetical protein
MLLQVKDVEMWAENFSGVPIPKSAGLRTPEVTPENQNSVACLPLNFAGDIQGQDSSILPRSPLRFDRMPDQSGRPFREGPGYGHSSTHGAAAPLSGSGATAGQRSAANRRPAPWRRDLLIEDMKDLLGRAVIYALAVLGLLHVLSLVATA